MLQPWATLLLISLPIPIVHPYAILLPGVPPPPPPPLPQYMPNQSPDKDGKIGSRCNYETDCAAAFSTCLHGVCGCKPGLVPHPVWNMCLATRGFCPYGIPALDNDNGIKACSIQGDNGEPDGTACPLNYYCAPYSGQGSTTGEQGHCCPMPLITCPVGSPHPNVLCQRGSDQQCPPGFYCYEVSVSGVAVAIRSVCCPEPCRGGNVLRDGTCMDPSATLPPPELVTQAAAVTDAVQTQAATDAPTAATAGILILDPAIPTFTKRRQTYPRHMNPYIEKLILPCSSELLQTCFSSFIRIFNATNAEHFLTIAESTIVNAPVPQIQIPRLCRRVRSFIDCFGVQVDSCLQSQLVSTTLGLEQGEAESMLAEIQSLGVACALKSDFIKHNKCIRRTAELNEHELAYCTAKLDHRADNSCETPHSYLNCTTYSFYGQCGTAAGQAMCEYQKARLATVFEDCRDALICR